MTTKGFTSPSAAQNSAVRAAPAPAVGDAIREADPSQVRQWMQASQCVLIDVREPDEHARESIAGARLLPLSHFDPAKAASFAQPGQTIVMHCKSGRRGGDACRMAASLSARGFPVVNLTGGIEAWKQAGLPVNLNTQVSGISIMRQVQLVVGLFVLGGSALAWFIDPRLIAIPAFFGAGLTFAGATGTCALATVLGWMPWNRAAAASCTTNSCG